ncbi:MAG TPA: hypothetical protein PLF21_00755 [Exilispira sp.]|nr:hypothetical protein [Exilispira sp.]
MKKNLVKDILLILFIPIIFIIFGFIPFLFTFYKSFNSAHPYIMSFIKFAILATYGEIASFRISNKRYPDKSFGILPKMLVWGILGIFIKAAFVIFSNGAIALLISINRNFPSNILATKGLSLLKILASFSISLTMNLIFAPVMMAAHKITDLYIAKAGGTFGGIFKTRFVFTELLKDIDWKSFGGFVLCKTIPFFWIPAHTITFLLNQSYQVLFAALLSVALGLLLAYKPIKNVK